MACTKITFYAILAVAFVSAFGIDHQSADISHDVDVLPMQMRNFQLSPSCWVRGMKRIYEVKNLAPETTTRNENALHTMICQVMTFEHQQVLALELTKCHMESVGRTISDSICEHDMILSPTGLRTCLANVDDSTLNAYTIFFQYVNQNCIRLTSEIATARYHESAMILAETSTIAMEKMSEIITKQEKVIISQGNATQYYEENKKQMQMFQNELKDIVRILGTMSTTVKPLLGVRDHIMRVTESFTWYATFIYFFGSVCIAWIITMSKRLKKSRRHVFGIIVIEALAEFFLHEVTRRGISLGKERSYVIAWLRSWAFYLECGSYLLGLVLYFFRLPEVDESSSRDVHALYAEMASRLEERSNEVMAKQKLREEALMEALHELKRNSALSTKTSKFQNVDEASMIDLPLSLKSTRGDCNTQPRVVRYRNNGPTVCSFTGIPPVDREDSEIKTFTPEKPPIQPKLDLLSPRIETTPTFVWEGAEKNNKKRVLSEEERPNTNGPQSKKSRK